MTTVRSGFGMTELVVGSAVPLSNTAPEVNLKDAKMLLNTSHLPQSEAQKKLQSFVDRIERLEEEKRELSSAITDIYNVAKSDGYDVKALRTVIRLRRKDKEERTDELNAIDTYLHALGMV